MKLGSIDTLQCDRQVKFCNGDYNAAIVLSKLLDLQSFNYENNKKITIDKIHEVLREFLDAKDIEHGLNYLISSGIIEKFNDEQSSLNIEYLNELYRDWLNEISQIT